MVSPVDEQTTPKRIQRQRTRGWRMPEGAVYVGRPSKWGNPFQLHDGRVSGLVREPGALTGQSWEFEGRISADGARHDYHRPDGRITVCHVRYATPAEVVELFRRALLGEPDAAIAAAWGRGARPVKPTVEQVRAELAGRDLCCWCPLVDASGNPVPCHADVLLEVANKITEPAS